MVRVEPLGLEMIGGALAPAHDVEYLDLRVTPAGLPDALARSRPQMVGITSTFTTDWTKTQEIARVIKAASPDTFVFAGGHHASLRPRDFHYPELDALVVGEGEITARELADCLAARGDLLSVKGLILNTPGGQRYTGDRPLVANLDTLPHPLRFRPRSESLKWPYNALMVGPTAAIETARGCPFRCSFCSVWRFYSGRVRFKSPERVVDELAQTEEPTIFVTDDDFFAGTRRSEAIASLIKERGIHKRYLIQARSDHIARHPELVKMWKEIGLYTVFIGFEKPDQAGLESVNKHNSVEHNEQALAVLRAHGVEPLASFILDPAFSREDFAHLQGYVRRLKLRHASFSILTPLPGTEFFDQVEDQLTTTNYDLWDLLHLVLPSRLPAKEFYERTAGLYRAMYPGPMLAGADLFWLLNPRRLPRESAAQARRMVAEARRIMDHRTYQ
jgi:radical SAM superfamily enzyme YgiQ (UPF0313 family)